MIRTGETDDSLRRIAILGASNVTVGLPRIVRLIETGFPGRLQIDVAHGHGRSWGQWSRVLMRGLPGHLQSEIWDDAGRPAVTHALLTDIGNDLLYGVDADRIAGWVRDCAKRLATSGAEVVLTQLPVQSVESLSAVRFGVFRTLFFPGSRLTREAAIVGARRLDRAIAEIGAELGAVCVTLRPDWYGIDPIHIRRGARDGAWREMLAHFSGWAAEQRSERRSRIDSLRLWRQRPRQRTWFGREQRCKSVVLRSKSVELRVF